MRFPKFFPFYFINSYCLVARKISIGPRSGYDNWWLKLVMDGDKLRGCDIVTFVNVDYLKTLAITSSWRISLLLCYCYFSPFNMPLPIIMELVAFVTLQKICWLPILLETYRTAFQLLCICVYYICTFCFVVLKWGCAFQLLEFRSNMVQELQYIYAWCPKYFWISLQVKRFCVFLDIIYVARFSLIS